MLPRLFRFDSRPSARSAARALAPEAPDARRITVLLPRRAPAQLSLFGFGKAPRGR